VNRCRQCRGQGRGDQPGRQEVLPQRVPAVAVQVSSGLLPGLVALLQSAGTVPIGHRDEACPEYMRARSYALAVGDAAAGVKAKWTSPPCLD